MVVFGEQESERKKDFLEKVLRYHREIGWVVLEIWTKEFSFVLKREITERRKKEKRKEKKRKENVRVSLILWLTL